MENYRLQHENKLIKKEKAFLIEQIKFMQNLIKSNNVNIHNKNPEAKNENFDIEKNLNTDLKNNVSHLPVTRPINLNGGNQKPLGKIFSVFVICMLSMVYVSFDSDFSNDEKITVRNGSTFSLNDSSDRSRQQNVNNNFSSLYSNILKFLFVLICGIVTWNISKLKNYIGNVFRIKDKNL
jgi:hypothetical protein